MQRSAQVRVGGLASPGRHTLVASSGVDLISFRPGTAQPTQPPLVSLPARFLRHKGVVEFARTARMLSARGCCARRALAVDPSCRIRYRAPASGLQGPRCATVRSGSSRRGFRDCPLA